MIRIDRPSVPEPKSMRERAPALEKLRVFYGLPAAKRSQRRWPFRSEIYLARAVRNAVNKLFHGKCAYCESPAIHPRGDVHHFRPKSRAHGIKRGDVAPDHYWWLVYDWDNLYLACARCNRYKGTRFPVKTRRVEPEARGDALANERPVLLDPCRDEPETELTFDAHGKAIARTARGHATIKILHLNRKELVEARRMSIAMINGLITALASASAKERTRFERELNRLTADDQPYAAARRAHWKRVAEHRPPRSFKGVVIPSPETIRVEVPRPTIQERARRVEGANWLETIHIENFKALHEIDLRFPEPLEQDGTVGEPWIMLLGENGVGKSSILKAIALALSSPALRRRLVGRAGDCFNRRASRGKGRISLTFTSGKPLELRFTRESEEFEEIGKRPRLSVLGYGSTRLMPKRFASRPPQPKRTAVENLFDPTVQLVDAESWLGSVDSISAPRFNLLATSLKALLSLDEEERLVRRGGRVTAQLDGAAVAIRELSDGYQSLFALATDLMLNLSSATFDMESVEGLVLLDEIEVHLHPQWKIEIVESLRALFPRVRFITTTHDPLCLNGLRKGEVHVLGRDIETRDIAIEQVDVPKGLRADQLLTGFWFGLNSTRDSETVDLLEDHGKLLLISRPSAAQRRRRAQIEQELRIRLGGFAETEDERLALEVVAETRRQPGSAPAPIRDRDALREKIVKHMKVIRSREGT